jgi:hypothetical protein
LEHLEIGDAKAVEVLEAAHGITLVETAGAAGKHQRLVLTSR